MAKRSNFARRPMDAYQTIDPRAVAALVPFLETNVETFAEPCCGDGYLIRDLERAGLTCVYAADITDESRDALETYDFGNADAIITNPPWTRPILHSMIGHFQRHSPAVWLLFDADWAHTKQAAPFLPQCSHIVSVGRLRWIPDTKQTGKDNCAWYRFDARHEGGPRFYGPVLREAA